MRFRLCVVGRPRDNALAAAIADYETRAARYWPLVVREVRAGSGGDARPDAVREAEGKRLLQAADGTARFLCDAGGERMNSKAFADWLAAKRNQARDVAFIIGGAYGLSDDVREGAAGSIALAPWTLAHEVARLVLAEQLYRAGAIVRGEPYHK
ncbi:MAG: 23S rRNA (pseudouridine(1915)-N(3))-methyltransferase RlmH [Gemmatimonadaceae bacterium]